MSGQPKRVCLYLRVSTREQATDNQRRELEQAAAARGWAVGSVYEDIGISGAKGRDGRPQLDLMLKDAVRRRFDLVMVWAIDRLGRSLPDLVSSMQELRAARVDLFVLQQGIDTTTPAGKAMFGMLGVFADFERSLIQARVQAGMDRAKDEQVAGKARFTATGRRKKLIGRPRLSAKREAEVRARLADGVGMLKVSKELGVGSGTVQRIKRAMLADPIPIWTEGRCRKQIGRPRLPAEKEAAVRARLAEGVSMMRVAAEIGCAHGTVQRIKRTMLAEGAVP